MKTKTLDDLQIGDAVIRELGGATMPLKVTNITSTEIQCGAWVFSRKTGGEIDSDLGWDENATGSYIRPALGRLGTVGPSSTQS